MLKLLSTNVKQEQPNYSFYILNRCSTFYYVHVVFDIRQKLPHFADIFEFIELK